MQVLHGTGISSQDGIVPMIIKELFNQTNESRYLITASMLQVQVVALLLQ